MNYCYYFLFYFNIADLGDQHQIIKPENQTIFIHQQQTPRGSIQVVHHQVKISHSGQQSSFPMCGAAFPITRSGETITKTFTLNFMDVI